MTGQMMFEFTKELPLGYVDNGEEMKGRMIPFKELRDYIGQRILLEMPRQSAVDYKVIKVTNYYEGEIDTIGYTDKKKEKENAWTRDIYCRNGTGTRMYDVCMYELKEGI